VRAGVLGIPDAYTPEKSWPVIVSLQDNPDPALTARTPYFLLHAGSKGVECSSNIHNYLKSLVGKYNIDIRRIYGTGFSRGGHELLEQTWHYPHLFAAIAPVCNDLRTEPKVFFVKYIQNTPTLLLHGDHDMFLRTGQRVHELMKAAGCPVSWGTFPGGHTPQQPFKKDVTLLTSFFEKHVFDPYPKRVVHVVLHPRYARAFWVDTCLVGDFLERPAPEAAEPASRPAGEKPAMVKPYGAHMAQWSVTVLDGNRIEVQANDLVAALDLYLTDKLVDMARPVTVTAGRRKLFQGPPACPLRVTLREGEPLKAAHLKPLWEELEQIQKAATYRPIPPKPAASGPAPDAGNP
jgi:dienelactone hydrolase